MHAKPTTGPHAGAVSTLRTSQMRRILASSFLGSAIEFYDFLLYASASALVFAHTFFASLDAMCSRSRRRSSFSARSSR